MNLVAFALATFLLTIVTGLLVIPLLGRLKAGQTVRAEGPQSHFAKTGTPTMGGLIFALPVLAVGLGLLALLPPAPGRAAAIAALAVAAGSGCIGLADDYLKVVLRRPLGLRAREKLVGQTLLGIGLAFVADQVLGLGTWVDLPFVGWRWELGALYYPFVLLLVIAAGNALNLTDGLDGLLASSAAITFLLYGAVAVARQSGHLATVSWATAMACTAFFFFNRHPARVFMGDVGSFFLGGALAALAVLTKTELLLPVAGGLYALETLSVIVQVASFQLLGRRIFRMSPLHHHFELAGWPEQTVVARFWAVNAAFAALGWLGLQAMR